MLVALDHLERRYGGVGGVRDVSLHIPEGAVYALCGSNGAGKTTTLAVLAGLMFAERGELRVRGERVPLDREVRREGMSFVPDSPVLDANLTGWQWAAFVSGIKGVAWPADAERYAGWMRLERDSLGRPIRVLSFGNRRKLALWVEMMTTTSVLILDEPLIGLDPEAIAGFHEAARAFVATGRSLLMSTHLLREAEALASHVGILVDGVTRHQGPLAEVCGQDDLQATFLRVVGAGAP